MGITARTLLTGAFDLCGVISPGETPKPYDMQDGLRRLIQMIRGWSIQSLTIPYIAREVFPLVANQSTYTIGSTGQLATTRPLSLEGAGLLLNAGMTTFAVTAVSTSANTFTVAGNQTGSFVAGQEFQLSGSVGNNGAYDVVSSTFGTSTVITVLQPIFSATAGGTISLAETPDLEIPRAVITDDAYQAIAIKTLSNSLFTSVYYNATFPNGTIYLWPVPNTAQHALVIYRGAQLSTFADLTTDYNVPPGYEDALEYGIAGRLLAPYAIKDPTVIQMVMDGATKTLAIIKRQNTRMSDMDSDARFATHDPRFGYNILTGNQ